MSSNPNDTLDAALALLGVSDDQPAHHRSNLVRAIHAHASASGKVDLAFACEARLNLIKAEGVQHLNDMYPDDDADQVASGNVVKVLYTPTA